MAGGQGRALVALRRGLYTLRDGPGRLETALRNQWERRVLWLAPGFGAGVAAYFALAKEPAVWVSGSAIVGATLCCAVAWRRGHAATALLVLLLSAAIGFGAAQLRSAWVAAPVLHREVGPTRAEGRVMLIEPSGSAWRVTLADLDIRRLRPEATPDRVRLRVRKADDIRLGDRVAGTVKLLPPPAPVVPGGFDFARQAWFDRLGGVGFVYGGLEVVDRRPSTWADRLGAAVEAARMDVAARLRSVVGGSSGGVAAALATGYRGAVPPPTEAAYRASGLAHMLSISGLHMTLAAGLVFVTVRAMLALLPRLALRYDAKKIAAVFAIASMTVYLGLSGAAVPAQRAYVMGSVVFIAVLLDRSPLSLRTLALAAFLVMVLRPEAVVEPGFQMSFAAVTALIAAWETLAPRVSQWRAAEGGLLPGPMRSAAVYLGGATFSTVVAGLATAPYGAFHFHAVALYSAAANLAAMPLMSFWIMPWLVLTLLLMPLHLEHLAGAPLRLGLDVVEAIGATVASWPGALLHVPPFPAAALALLTLGGLWTCLWRGGVRWLGLPLIAAAVIVPWAGDIPHLLVSGDGGLAAVRSGDGLVLSPGRKDRFTRNIWIETWGRGQGAWSASGLVDGDASIDFRCDGTGCLYRGGEATAAFVRHEAALREDCATADVVIATVPVRRRDCRAPLVIDFFALRRDGTHEIVLLPGGDAVVRSVGSERGQRPWTSGPNR